MMRTVTMEQVIKAMTQQMMLKFLGRLGVAVTLEVVPRSQMTLSRAIRWSQRLDRSDPVCEG